MTESILSVGPVPYFAERLEQLATKADLSFASKFALAEVVIIASSRRPSEIVALCQCQGVRCIIA